MLRVINAEVESIYKIKYWFRKDESTRWKIIKVTIIKSQNQRKINQVDDGSVFVQKSDPIIWDRI